MSSDTQSYSNKFAKRIWSRRYILLLIIVSVVLLVAILTVFSGILKPDWRNLYSKHINRQVMEFDESFINQEYYDIAEGGTLTRVAWAKLDDGTIIFLGLPPYGPNPEEVINRTVILTQEEWKQACENAFEEKITGWWFIHEHRGNSLRVNVANVDQVQPNSYCEFYYLPNGWELRKVRISEVIKPYYFP